MATSLLRPSPEAGGALAVLKDSGCWAERMTEGPGLQTEHTFVSPEKRNVCAETHNRVTFKHTCINKYHLLS